MLLGPEDGEQFRDPEMDRSQAVKPGMAAGADSDEQIGITVPGTPVVNMEEAGLPTAPALILVALKELPAK